MKRSFLIISSVIVSFSAIVLLSCKKDAAAPANPFDDPSLKAPEPVPSGYNPSSTSFEYLYEQVFKKTCANSNCHDGAFEPDFRTVNAAYNTLVYAPVVLTPTNTSTNYKYRVVPGNADLSCIKLRLTQVPATGAGTIGQGRMPFINPNWMNEGNNATYIQNIIDWINQGAKDIYGVAPTFGNKNPNTLGLEMCPGGNNTPFNRSKYIEIPLSNLSSVDLWAYIVDDSTAASNMVSAEVKFSLKRYDFSVSNTQTLTYVPNGNTYPDITNNNSVKYTHKLSGFNLSTMRTDTGYVFVRTYIKDPNHTTPAETPNTGAAYYSDYFVIKVIQ